MRTSIRAALVAPLLLLLAGCSPIVALEPAADATNPDCAAVIVRLPDTVGDLDRRETNAQGTGAWGDPADVRLYCGVPTPDPTSQLRCIELGGVDWLIDDSKAPDAFAVSYGRTPAVQVFMTGDAASGVVLKDLGDAVSVLPKTGACISPDDATAN